MIVVQHIDCEVEERDAASVPVDLAVRIAAVEPQIAKSMRDAPAHVDVEAMEEHA